MRQNAGMAAPTRWNGAEVPEVPDMTPLVADRGGPGDLRARIEAIGARAAPRPSPPCSRPSPGPGRGRRGSRRAIGLDKSLASRLVRAVQSSSDLDLMHLVPSPAGLHIFADLAARYADPASIGNLRGATERFEELLDSVPGGRASIDAQISESSHVALAQREHIAKQASFKSMSFLLGHFCDVLTTSLFLVPSANGRRVDGIEIQRRIGLRRMRPSTPLALLSIWGRPRRRRRRERDPLRHARWRSAESANPSASCFPRSARSPIPELEVVREGEMTALVLAGDPSLHTPSQLTSAIRIRNGWPLKPEAHDPGPARIRAAHALPAARARRLHRRVALPGRDARRSRSCSRARARPADAARGRPSPLLRGRPRGSIEHLPGGPQSYEIPGVVNHAAAVRHVLERAGHGLTRFRGWRSAMTYPVSLVEMVWWLTHPSINGPAKPTNGEAR